MTKSDMLHAIEKAKKSHQQQMIKLKKLLEGQKVENPTALGKLECEFGQWFYGQKEYIIQVVGLQLFERLDLAHELWHKEYKKIYDIFFKQKKGFLSKLMGNNKVDPLELDKAKVYYKELETLTEHVLNAADAMTRRANALHESKF